MQFNSLGACISWFLTHNPARQKFVNVLEPERLIADTGIDRDEQAAAWALVAGAIFSVLADNGRQAAAAFNLVWLRRPESVVTDKFHRDDAARLLGISRGKLRRVLDDVCDQLETELKTRQILV